MPFIGNQPALAYTSFAKQDFTTSVTTSYTLDNPVTNENEIALFINFVRQEPTTAYTASGTSLTLTSATSASDDMYCVFLGKAVQTVNPPAGSVGTSQLADASITSAKLASGVGGKVLQVASVTKTDTFSASINSDTSADITDLSLSITPSSTSSKILIMFNLQAATTTTSRQSNFGMRLVRDTTFISLADTASNRPRTTSTFCLNHTDDGNATGIVAGSFLDSPSTTSSTTYKIQLHNITSGTLTYYVNRTASDADLLNYRPRSTSTLTVMEISG